MKNKCIKIIFFSFICGFLSSEGKTDCCDAPFLCVRNNGGSTIFDVIVGYKMEGACCRPIKPADIQCDSTQAVLPGGGTAYCGYGVSGKLCCIDTAYKLTVKDK